MNQRQPVQTISQDVQNELAAFQRAALEARKIAVQTNTGVIIRRQGQLTRLSAEVLSTEAPTQNAAE